MNATRETPNRALFYSLFSQMAIGQREGNADRIIKVGGPFATSVETEYNIDRKKREKRMKNKTKAVYILIAAWVAVYVLGRFSAFNDASVAKGIENINGEYYRYFTASFVHFNFVHLLANCGGAYFITIYLDGRVKGYWTLLVGLLGGTLAQLVMSFLSPLSVGSYGGSPIVFSIIGLIAVMLLMCKDRKPFRLGTWYGNWTLGYIVIGNVFNGAFRVGDWSTVVLHLVGFAAGALIGLVLIGIKAVE